MFFRTVYELVYKNYFFFVYLFLIALKSPAVCSECKLIKGPEDKILCDHLIRTIHIYSGAKLKLNGQF